MFKSKIEIEGNKEMLQAYKAALEPEQSFKSERAGYDLKLEKDKLIITVSAQDATAFRSIVTSLSGLISVVEKTWRQKENGKRTG